MPGESRLATAAVGELLFDEAGCWLKAGNEVASRSLLLARDGDGLVCNPIGAAPRSTSGAAACTQMRHTSVHRCCFGWMGEAMATATSRQLRTVKQGTQPPTGGGAHTLTMSVRAPFFRAPCSFAGHLTMSTRTVTSAGDTLSCGINWQDQETCGRSETDTYARGWLGEKPSRVVRWCVHCRSTLACTTAANSPGHQPRSTIRRVPLEVRVCKQTTSNKTN